MLYSLSSLLVLMGVRLGKSIVVTITVSLVTSAIHSYIYLIAKVVAFIRCVNTYNSVIDIIIIYRYAELKIGLLYNRCNRNLPNYNDCANRVFFVILQFIIWLLTCLMISILP